MEDFNPNNYELKEIYIEDIDVGNRMREELDKIPQLASDIAENGVITPIAVVDKEGVDGGLGGFGELNPDKRYLLVAGERRTRASAQAGLDSIPAKVYTRAINEWQIRVLELHENIFREDMTPFEEAKAEKEIHDLYVQRRGKGDTSGKGHSQQDTADMLGVSRAKVTQDFEIAEWGEEFEEVRTASTKSEAKRFIKRKKEEIAAAEKARRLEEKQEESEETGEIEVSGGDGKVKKFQKNLNKRFILGNYFDKIKDLPNRSIDLLELDPDWGIDFIKKRAAKNNIPWEESYQSIPPEAYEETFQQILEAAWPKLKDHSWVIVWYSIERWHKQTRDILDKVGFRVCDMPAFWVKESGNTATPAYRLGEGVAAFYYARKGSPRIQNPGRNNTFHYRTLNKNERMHPAEKPVELYEDILQTFAKQGQVVVSGFAGSGNILLAAENHGMNSVGFDLSEEYKNDFSLKVFNNNPGNYYSYDRR